MGIKKNNSGLTILELVISMAVLTLLVPFIFALFLNSLRTQTKVLILQEVKNNGDFTLNIIDDMVKLHALTIYSDQAKTTEVCTTNTITTTPASYTGPLYFDDEYGQQFYFAIDDTKIASYSSVISPNPQYLTNNRVRATSLTLSCERSALSSLPVVGISFTVSNPAASTKYENQASLNFQTKTKLRVDP